jgi:hypothetical protein
MGGMEMGEGTRDVILLVNFSPGPSALSPTVRIAGFQANRLKKLLEFLPTSTSPRHLMVTKVITTKHRHWTTCVQKKIRGACGKSRHMSKQIPLSRV